MDASLRETVIGRSRGSCDLCGERADPEAMHAHHRKLRTRGGEDSLANLVGLHPACHGWVHDHPDASARLGFMVASWEDPAAVPLLLHGRRKVIAGETWRDR